MIVSKRNPLLRRSNETGVDQSVGSLIDDIRSQDLEGITGGTGVACWAHDRITLLINCGVFLTFSAECSLTHLPC